MQTMPVFQPNNHSQWEIKYRPVEAGVTDLVTKVLKEHYAIGGGTGVEQVAEAEVNSNNFKVTTSSGTFLLRRHVVIKDRAVIERTLNLMKQLQLEGVRVPELIRTASGDLVATASGEMYTLFVFIEANHYRGTIDELRSVAQELSRLDLALSQISTNHDWKSVLSLPEKARELRLYDLSIWQQLFSAARERQKTEPDPFHDQFLTQEDFILAAVENTLKQKPDDVVWGLVHFDLHPHNLLADGKNIVAIIDFDSLRYLERMRALAFALHRMTRQYIVFNHLTDYSAAISEAKKVFGEPQNTAYFICDEALARLSYAMKDQYFNNNSAWRQDLVKQTGNIAEAAYFN